MTDAEFASKTSRKKVPEDEADEAGELYGYGQGEAGGPPADGGGTLPPRRPAWSDHDAFFAFIREKHLDEAQEFRRQGYNSRVPGVDPGLLPQLRAAAETASRLIHLHAREEGPRGRSWLLEKISALETFAERVSGNAVQTWVNDELTRERLSVGGADAVLNRSAAQSLARRLTSTLQTLTRVARALGSVVDFSTPENLHGAVREALVSELTGAIAPGDGESVTQALGRMAADGADNAAWSGLMDMRVAARAASKPATFDAVIDVVRRDADKASKKARTLSGGAQVFFSDIAAFLLGLSAELKAERSASGQEAAGDITENAQDDKAVARRAGLKGLSRKLSARVRQGGIQSGIVGTTVSKYGGVAARVIRHGEVRGTPSKRAGRIVADSITRSILWQWQQPVIKLQQASGAILTKVSELKKIRDLFSADAAASAADAAEESGCIPGAEPREDDRDAQVRQWVNERTEQEQPAGQRAAKLAVLGQLLKGDIAHARRQVARVGSTTESIENMLKRQRAAVVSMIYERRSADTDAALKAVNELLPEITGRLAGTVVALEKALRAAGQPGRDFSAAGMQAQEAQLRATEAREWISTRSVWLTGRTLDENSRGTRIARHWASLAGERHSGPWQAPDARAVWTSLKNQGLTEATLSRGDPEGYLFATRLAGELENASNDELKLPMSPDEYVALEKSLVGFIANWGQKRVARGGARLVVELSFEQAVDAVTFGLSGLLRVPYKVLKASVKIPYRVNKVNNYTMPGQDRPYKAMYALLGKKLKQLGFNLVTAPVPGVIRLPIGAVSAAGAALYNHQLEAKEKTFSAVYERVALGGKSEKIKTGSAQGMLFDSVLDAGVVGGAKGVRKGISRAGTGGKEAIPRATGVRLMPPAEGGETLTPLSATKALRRIADAGEPELKALASRLLLQPDIDRVPLWQSDLSGHSRYNLSGRWIKLGADASDREIMHEITHGLTADKLRYGQAHPGSALGRQVTELDALRRNALAGYQGEDPQTRHYLSHLDEFVSGLFSGNSDFIDHLQALDNKGRSLLQSVMESLCWLLGLLPAQESALSRAMGLTDAIMQAPPVAPEGNVAGDLYYGGTGGTNSYKGSVKGRQAASPARQTSGAGSAVDWQTFDGRPVHGAQRSALLSWLAALTPQARRAWFSSRKFSNDFDKDLNIYLAESHFIYDDMVSGADYFAWVNQFMPWPATFQRDNRVVGILRDVRMPADFPAGKGFLFTLRDDTGGVIFSKTYFPDVSAPDGNQSGLWHKNILEQIATDMEKLPADRSVTIANIMGYEGKQPALGQGATVSPKHNVFITSADSQVATADFRFIDASENIVPVSEELSEGEKEQQPPREEQSDPVVGAGKVSDYFLKQDNVSAEIRQDILVWTTISGSNIDPDERNEAYNAYVYLWEPGKPGKLKLTAGQYLKDDAYLDSRYQMMILPRDHPFADENSTPTEDDRRWPGIETLYQSSHIRQLHQKIFDETSDEDAEVVSSPGENVPAIEGKTHIQGTKSWETDNQQRFSLQGERDLVTGEKVLVSVRDELGLVEYIEITVPVTKLGRHRWPAYVAAKINREMKFVQVGDQGQSAAIGVKTSTENYLWSTNGQVVEWQILREGTAPVLPAEDNAHWRVPASDTWATIPPRLALPRSIPADERLVVWVENKNSGELIERLEIPAQQEPNERTLSQAINQSASHMRVGELSDQEVTPTDDPGGNVFWVDNDDYIVKYALVPAESMDKGLQLQQRYQLLWQLINNSTQTRAFLASGKHHPYTALDRSEINRLLSLPQREVIKLHSELSEAGLPHQEVMADEDWIHNEKTLINGSVNFKTLHPLPGSAAENRSFVKAKTDALRYFLQEYPYLAEGMGVSSTTVDQHQLLSAANDIYARLTPEQKNDFIFVTALNWKLATDTSFNSRIISLTGGTTLELFGLREEVITEYETALSKEIFGNADSKSINFKPRSESSSDEAYFKQFADYIKDNISDEAKRMSRLQMSQSGINSFDMLRPATKSVKITMKVPVHVEIKTSQSRNRFLKNKPAAGDVYLFKTDSGRYFIYSSVGESVFLQEVNDTFSEAELTDILNGNVSEPVNIKLEALFQKKISLDDVSTEGGFGSFNSTKRQSESSSSNEYVFSAQVENNQDIQTKLEAANLAFLRHAVDQNREQNFKLNNWEKLRDAIIPFYKRWSRFSKDPTYEHSEEDSYNDLMNLFGLLSVPGAGVSGAAKAGRSLGGVLRSGRPAGARAMLALLERGAQAAAPGLREALKGMAAQLASEMFPPLDLARAARAGGRYARRAIGRGRTGGINGSRNKAEGNGQSIANRNLFRAQNSVSVDLSDAARYQPSGYDSSNAPNNLYIKDGQIYLQRSDGVFELDAIHGGRTLRVRVPGQTPHTGPEIIYTSSGFIEKGPSGLGGQRYGGSRIPLGDNRGQPIRGTLGRQTYGWDNRLSKPRNDLTPEGTWPIYDSLPEAYDKTKALDNRRSYKNLNAETKVNTKIVTRKIEEIFQDYVIKNPVPLDAAGKPKFSVSAIGFGPMAREELLLVSDIDLQLIVVARDAHAVEARAYAKAMMDNVKSEWSKVRGSVSTSPDAMALQVDSVGGVEGIIIVGSAEEAAVMMKPSKLGSKGYSDIYADSHAIYESKPGTYENIFEGYEAKLQNSEVNGLVDEAISDLGALPEKLISAKQTIIRPITLAVGGLYRKLRAKLGTKLSYETNTLKRAQILKMHGLIDEATYQNIEEVLLRSFKWEQQAGLESFQHGQHVLPKHASLFRTRGIYNKTRQIKKSLTNANNKINRMPAAPSLHVARSVIPDLDNGGGRRLSHERQRASSDVGATLAEKKPAEGELLFDLNPQPDSSGALNTASVAQPDSADKISSLNTDVGVVRSHSPQQGSHFHKPFGPDSYIEMGPNNNTVIIRAHGYPGDTGHFTAEGVAGVIRKYLDSRGISLQDIRHIELQSCYGNTLGRFSQAQAIANKLQVKVKGYSGIFTQRRGNNPADGSFSRPQRNPVVSTVSNAGNSAAFHLSEAVISVRRRLGINSSSSTQAGSTGSYTLTHTSGNRGHVRGRRRGRGRTVIPTGFNVLTLGRSAASDTAQTGNAATRYINGFTGTEANRPAGRQIVPTDYSTFNPGSSARGPGGPMVTGRDLTNSRPVTDASGMVFFRLMQGIPERSNARAGILIGGMLLLGGVATYAGKMDYDAGQARIALVNAENNLSDLSEIMVSDDPAAKTELETIMRQYFGNENLSPEDIEELIVFIRKVRTTASDTELRQLVSGSLPGRYSDDVPAVFSRFSPQWIIGFYMHIFGEHEAGRDKSAISGHDAVPLDSTPGESQDSGNAKRPVTEVHKSTTNRVRESRINKPRQKAILPPIKE